ncbi:MAG: hypothetical protein GY856_29150 [bacterium]|nr:hypothetical protein [bacterium]
MTVEIFRHPPAFHGDDLILREGPRQLGEKVVQTFAFRFVLIDRGPSEQCESLLGGQLGDSREGAGAGALKIPGGRHLEAEPDVGEYELLSARRRRGAGVSRCGSGHEGKQDRE